MNNISTFESNWMWHVPVDPATWDAEAEGSLKPRNSRW